MDYNKLIWEKHDKQKTLIEKDKYGRIVNNPITYNEIIKLQSEINQLLLEQLKLIDRRQKIEKIRTKISR